MSDENAVRFIEPRNDDVGAEYVSLYCECGAGGRGLVDECAGCGRVFFHAKRRWQAIEAAAKAVVESAGTYPSRALYADIEALRLALGHLK